MNIILGQSQAEQLKDKHLVLELDTITIGNSNPITAYCVVEELPLNEIPLIEPLTKLHTSLMENYRKRDWRYCEQAIHELIGKWGNQVDTFYADLLERVTQYKQTEPDESWTGIIAKN